MTMTDEEHDKHMRTVCFFAMMDVERWRAQHGPRMPTLEELQGEPFNFTDEFARYFLAYVDQHSQAKTWKEFLDK